MDPALEVLEANWTGAYTLPARGLYPHQWNWDSALITLGWAQVKPKRAWKELDSLVGGAHPNGMIPHIIFNSSADSYLPGPDWWGKLRGQDGRFISLITQPPLAASILKLLFEKYPQEEKASRLIAPLTDWHRYLMGRSLDNLPYIIHPWESGRDNSPEWDVPLRAVPKTSREFTRRDTDHVDERERPLKEDYEKYLYLVEAISIGKEPFRALDPGFSYILLRACYDLAILAEELHHPEFAEENFALYEKLALALKAHKSSSGFLYAHDFIADSSASTLSCGSLLEILDPGISSDHAQRLQEMMQSGAFASPFGVRSYPGGRGSDLYKYWRGPVWDNITFLCRLGLEFQGLDYQQLVNCHHNFVSSAGYVEYVHPESGERLGARNFSWTAAIDLWERGISA